MGEHDHTTIREAIATNISICWAKRTAKIRARIYPISRIFFFHPQSCVFFFAFSRVSDEEKFSANFAVRMATTPAAPYAKMAPTSAYFSPVDTDGERNHSSVSLQLLLRGERAKCADISDRWPLAVQPAVNA